MVDRDRSALVTIDVQRDFYEDDAPTWVPGTAERVPAMARVARAFRAADRPTIHVVRLYAADGSNAEPGRRDAVTATGVVRPGTRGSEVAPDLLPPGAAPVDPGLLLAGGLQAVGPAEWYMFKPRWGMFYRTPLEQHLRQLGVGRVVVVGCNFPNCPRTSIYEASERDLGAAIVVDAVSGVYGRGLRELEGIGVEVTSSSAVVAEMDR